MLIMMDERMEKGIPQIFCHFLTGQTFNFSLPSIFLCFQVLRPSLFKNAYSCYNSSLLVPPKKFRYEKQIEVLG